MAKKKIKNLIFDMGGVLVDLDEARCMDAFNRIGASGLSAYVDKYRCASLFHDFEVGSLSQPDFCEAVRKLTGMQMTDADIAWAWNQLLVGIPDRRKQRLLELRRSYRMFLLSNTNAMHWTLCSEHLFNYGEFGYADYFEQTFLSHEMHMAKPSQDIFRATLAQAKLVAEETLFIDDSQANCEGARLLGMQTFFNEKPDDWLKLDL